MDTNPLSDFYAAFQAKRPQINKLLIYVGALCGAAYCGFLGFQQSQWGGMIIGIVTGMAYGAFIGFLFPKLASFLWAFFLTSILVFIGVFILIHALSLTH